MATTLATRKQAEEIKQRMREIRTELPYDVDDARERFKQLSDWKHYVREYPLPILAAAVVVGYLVVPTKRNGTVVVHRDSEQAITPAKRSFVGGIAASVATLLLRQATSMAASQATNWLSNRNQRPSNDHSE